MPPISLPALVPPESRTVVRRHVDDAAPAELRGENRASGWETVSTENLDRPAHRASQSHRVSGPSATDSRLRHSFANDPARPISLAGPLTVRLHICETGTQICTEKVQQGFEAYLRD